MQEKKLLQVFPEGHKKTITHSTSTPRLFVQPRKAITEQPTEEAPKRYASTEGRFSIIDECSKDSSDSDLSDCDSPLPQIDHFQKQKVVRPNFSKSVDCGHSGSTMTSASRFRIVPIESRYKRGRWTCFDYYDKETVCSKNPKISCPGPTSPYQTQPATTDRSVRSLTEISAPPATAPMMQQKAFNFDVSSDSDRENSEPPFNKSHRNGMIKDPPKVVLPAPEPTISTPPANKVLNSSPSCNTGRMTPTELLQNTLETTLNTSDLKTEECSNTACGEDETCCTSSNNNGQSPALVAIDSKIEQAMDLVKTHLMFAVREEVEVLRNKIVDLESHIHHLETENAVLRDHIPEDLLKSLNISKSK